MQPMPDERPLLTGRWRAALPLLRRGRGRDESAGPAHASARAPRAGVRPRPRPGADARDRGPAARRGHRARAARWRGDRRGPRPLRVLDGRRGGDARVEGGARAPDPHAPAPRSPGRARQCRPSGRGDQRDVRQEHGDRPGGVARRGRRPVRHRHRRRPADRRGHRRRALGRARGWPDDRRDVRVGRDPHRAIARRSASSTM